MSRILKKLEEWHSNKLISDEQLVHIQNYESNQPKVRWGQLSLLILGIATIVLGIIAIVASNWDKIPPGLKLISGFAVLIIVGSALVVRRNDSPFLKDSLIAFFSLFCFAMIGLIAQIYNLQGDGYKTGLLWSAMTLMILSYARHIFVPLLWSCVLGFSLLSACYSWPPLKQVLAEPSSFFIYSLTLVVLCLNRVLAPSPIRKSLTYYTVAMWLGLLCLSSFNRSISTSTNELALYVPQYALSLLLGIVLWSDSTFKKSEKIALTSGLIVSNILVFISANDSISDIPTIALSIYCLLVGAFFFFSQGYTSVYNFVLILVGSKIFEIYTRTMVDLLQTGMGLILTGLSAILLVFAWTKNRKKIETLLQGLIK